MPFNKHFHTDPNENYPKSFQQEARMSNSDDLASAKLEGVMDELCQIAQILANRGHDDYGDRAFRLSEMTEELRNDIRGDGFDSAA